jgi:hypothetical protein
MPHSSRCCVLVLGRIVCIIFFRKGLQLIDPKVWAIFWVIFELAILAGFVLLGIAVFKVLRPVNIRDADVDVVITDFSRPDEPASGCVTLNLYFCR